MCQGTYTVSQGYRKIAGDTCTGGVDHAPLVLPCPGIMTIYTEKPSYFYSLIAIMTVIYLIYQGYLDNLLQLVQSFIPSSRGTQRPQRQGKGADYEKIDEEMQDVESFFQSQEGQDELDDDDDDLEDGTINLGDGGSDDEGHNDNENKSTDAKAEDDSGEGEKRDAVKLAAKKVPALKKKGAKGKSAKNDGSSDLLGDDVEEVFSDDDEEGNLI